MEWWKRNRLGFTMIEATITLGIICAILLIPVMNFQRFQKVEVEKCFYQELKNKWYKNLLTARLNNKRIRVYFYNDLILFRSNEQVIDRIQVPGTIEVANKPVVQISNDGTVRPETIKLVSKVSKSKVFKIQMDWGNIIED